ncbi:MAG: hypothetical protein ACR2GF_07435 [Acidimicrobiales bacterium]
MNWRQGAVARRAVVVLTLGGDGIAAITRFLDPDLPRLFGLAAASHPS